MSRINRGYYMPLFILFIMLYYIVTNLNEVITTKQYIDSVLNDNVNGLFLCELPTGYGKTYTITNCMREYAANPNNTRKIIYLTTLNKNLPEEDLKRAYNDEKLYNKEVLRIRSNFDEVVDKIPVLDIPEDVLRILLRWHQDHPQKSTCDPLQVPFHMPHRCHNHHATAYITSKLCHIVLIMLLCKLFKLLTDFTAMDRNTVFYVFLNFLVKFIGNLQIS